jgi:hypothetical protein
MLDRSLKMVTLFHDGQDAGCVINILCAGRIKEGKSSFALWLARNWKTGCTICFDPRHMIDEEMAEHAGFERIVIVDNAEQLETEIEEVQFDSQNEKRCLSTLIVFRPTGFDLASQFDAMSDVLFDPPEKFYNWALVVDEAATLQSAHSISPHLSRAVRQHPRSVLIIQTTHSLQDWHRASKDLMSHLFCFRLMGRSLKSVVEFCDGSEELEETIKTLPPHHLVHVNFEAHAGAPEFTVIDDPSLWWEGETVEDGNPTNAMPAGAQERRGEDEDEMERARR